MDGALPGADLLRRIEGRHQRGGLKDRVAWGAGMALQTAVLDDALHQGEFPVRIQRLGRRDGMFQGFSKLRCGGSGAGFALQAVRHGDIQRQHAQGAGQRPSRRQRLFQSIPDECQQAADQQQQLPGVGVGQQGGGVGAEQSEQQGQGQVAIVLLAHGGPRLG